MKKDYMERLYFVGRIWMVLTILVMLAVPTLISVRYNAWPEWNVFLMAMLGIAPIFWTVGIIETFTFIPMLGVGGSILSFVTGNITNLKLPAALNSLQAAKVEASSEEGEVISTLATGASAIVTTLIISIGVLFLFQLQPVLESPVLAPAFANILPALFGGLGVVFVSRNWKLALAPMIFMIALFVAIPALASAVGVLVPVGILVSVTVAKILYKRGLI